MWHQLFGHLSGKQKNLFKWIISFLYACPKARTDSINMPRQSCNFDIIYFSIKCFYQFIGLRHDKFDVPGKSTLDSP